jgi:hypothetical protein
MTLINKVLKKFGYVVMPLSYFHKMEKDSVLYQRSAFQKDLPDRVQGYFNGLYDHSRKVSHSILKDIV